MYDDLINKMVGQFSEIGLIINSKANDFSKINDISNEDYEMYYDFLCSDEIIPENINRRNHKMCCLFYLTKDSPKYKQDFIEQYLRTVEIQKIERSSENLVMVFNIIEFDKTYLDSSSKVINYLYSLLKTFSNFETDFQSFIIYKYYRGYLKFRLGDIDQANREYLEIASEASDIENILMKYIKLVNDLLKVRIYNVQELKNRADFSEYFYFLKRLFDEVKDSNKSLALKIGFDLFSAYLEGKEFSKCMGLLNEMKKILKKNLLKGVGMKNGIDYYLAIACRMGYMGILFDDKNVIQSAIKKIKKAILMINNDNNDKKNIELLKAYQFIIAIFEINLTQETKFDMRKLAIEFQNIFLPDLKSNAYKNEIVNEKNKENIIMDFKVINNMNEDFYYVSRSIKEKCQKELYEHKKTSITNFMNLLIFYHDKIFRYSESYITDENEEKKGYYKNKIRDYFNEANHMIKQFYDDPFFKLPFVKILIINIYYSYVSILLLEKKEFNKAKELIDDIMESNQNNLRKKLDIDKKISSYGLWLKVKGDFYLISKHFEAAIKSYGDALDILEKDHPKIPLILFNSGCAYYFLKNKQKAFEFLNLSINAFNNLNIKFNANKNDYLKNNYFGFVEKSETIQQKIAIAKSLIEALSSQNK